MPDRVKSAVLRRTKHRFRRRSCRARNAGCEGESAPSKYFFHVSSSIFRVHANSCVRRFTHVRSRMNSGLHPLRARCVPLRKSWKIRKLRCAVKLFDVISTFDLQRRGVCVRTSQSCAVSDDCAAPACFGTKKLHCPLPPSNGCNLQTFIFEAEEIFAHVNF
jgi:hypothetical protein